jgi:hypothetical protein
LQETPEDATGAVVDYQKVIHEVKTIFKPVSQSEHVPFRRPRQIASDCEWNERMTAGLKEGARAQLFGPTIKEMG